MRKERPDEVRKLDIGTGTALELQFNNHAMSANACEGSRRPACKEHRSPVLHRTAETPMHRATNAGSVSRATWVKAGLLEVGR
ncbi:hypothetical protein [Novosphingobium sp.]|uniref:hypothetical protein n=1 Tax=Novosphingobium sp. TaxID=1874826 RepID=UPI0038B8AE0F